MALMHAAELRERALNGSRPTRGHARVARCRVWSIQKIEAKGKKRNGAQPILEVSRRFRIEQEGHPADARRNLPEQL